MNITSLLSLFWLIFWGVVPQKCTFWTSKKVVMFFLFFMPVRKTCQWMRHTHDEASTTLVKLAAAGHFLPNEGGKNVQWVEYQRYVFIASFPNHPKLHSGGFNLYFCLLKIFFTVYISNCQWNQTTTVTYGYSPFPPFSNEQKRLTNDVAWQQTLFLGAFVSSDFT